MTDTRRDVAGELGLASAIATAAIRIRRMGYPGHADDLEKAHEMFMRLLRSEGREPDAVEAFVAGARWHAEPLRWTAKRAAEVREVARQHFGTPSDSPTGEHTVFLCAKCGYGSEEHGVEGHPAGQCIADMRLVPAAYYRASDSPTGEPEYPVDALTACIETVGGHHDASVAMGALAELRGLQRGVLLPVGVEGHLLVRHGTWQARCLECERLGPDEAAWWKQFDCRSSDSPTGEPGRDLDPMGNDYPDSHEGVARRIEDTGRRRFDSLWRDIHAILDDLRDANEALAAGGGARPDDFDGYIAGYDEAVTRYSVDVPEDWTSEMESDYVAWRQSWDRNRTESPSEGDGDVGRPERGV